MKTSNLIQCTVLASAIAAALANPATSFATEMFAVAPSAVYQAVRNTSIQTALTQVSARSGIMFKINTEIGKDVVRQNLSATDWETAVKSLLQSYNYTLVTNGKVLKTVIVTGHKGSGSSVELVHATAAVEPTDDYVAPIIINPKMGKLPKAYDSYPAGSVMAIDFPMKEIMSMGKDITTSMDTPLGQFNVAHDNSVSESDGSTTWIGHLADKGQGYRMILSQGPAGIMGNITTPEGDFYIENQHGAMVLVDASKLIPTGFEDDTNTEIIDETVGAGSITVDSVTLTVTQLTAAVSTTQTAVTCSNCRH
ncbi:MAG: hypothetical protein ACXV8Q_00075 [Methylobacter sp.]